MGKVIVATCVRNWDDLSLLAMGKLDTPLRALEIEALVDTGATSLYLKPSVIQALGLRQIGERKALTMSNQREVRRTFSPVQLEIQGRMALLEVAELSEDLPNIVGQVPLELMDWVVDVRGQKLIGNPDHGGEMLHEEF
ncbi:MAG: aspartyl protease family protein [Deltaproteobacteria bacterium]|nr:aspartyl protease family protein [Deltaproteobacteria bacterium]